MSCSVDRVSYEQNGRGNDLPSKLLVFSRWFTVRRQHCIANYRTKTAKVIQTGARPKNALFTIKLSMKLSWSQASGLLATSYSISQPKKLYFSLGFRFSEISAVPFVLWSANQKNRFFHYPRVSTGALPLTKKPVDSGYEIDFPVSCKINTERTKINSHWFESRTGIIISTSNFIMVPTCEIRTTFDSAELLTNWSVWWFFWCTENRHKHQKKEIFSQKKTKWPLSRRAWNTQALRAIIK